MIRIYWGLAVAIVLLAWIVSAAFYPGLPSTIPMHWNFHDQIDGYGPKGTIFLMPAFMIVWLGMAGLLPILSPKSFEVDASRTTYLYIMVLILAMFGYMQGVILYAAATNGKLTMSRAMCAGLFLFFALLGNVLGRVRRNFYMGIRVPWTLASERVWNDTHRVGAWFMVASGLAGFLITITGLPLVAAFAMLGVGIAAPVVYSFVHYKQLERRGAL